MEGALSGVKVLDLSRLLPGAFCSMLMADMGADVIKVEDPNRGDEIRWWPPKIGPNSGMHVVLNRNKRAITINLKTPEGKKIFEELSAESDVILESFRPGVMTKLGLGYEEVARINPRIIFCAISGYGSQGPMSGKAGHDINYLALNGVLSFSGRQTPTLSGVQIADIGGGGLMAITGILAALLARARLGRGQFVDISMMEGALVWNCIRWGKFIADGAVPEPADHLFNHGFACYNIYETRDGRYMTLGAIEPQFWKAFCRASGRNDWASIDHFKPGPHQQALTESIAEFFGKRRYLNVCRFSKTLIAAVNQF